MPGDRARSRAGAFWGVAIAVVALDIITKQLAVTLLSPAYEPHRVAGNAVRFTLVYNPGAAFSLYLGPSSRRIFIALTMAALAVLAALYQTTRRTDTLRFVALGLVSGGAIGNLLGRVRRPLGVVDFIDLGLRGTRFWTFNVADMGVTFGAVLLAMVFWRHESVPDGAPCDVASDVVSDAVSDAPDEQPDDEA
ncbi:MAG TPA: signal peptidase II [Gemmatimonadaceae bacterium]|nr:signal peptidase II [Gemmatimonadaceae bacterium]